MIRERLNDRECDRIAEQTAQPRLSITVFLHRGFLITFPEFRKRGMNTLMSSQPARSSPAVMGLVEQAMPSIEDNGDRARSRD